MTCQEFRELTLCLIRREPLAADVAQEAEEHRSQCDACRRHFEGEEALTANLRSLAAMHRDALPPKRVEARLRDEFARRSALAGRVAAVPVAKRHDSRVVWMAGAIGALAATVVLLFLFIAQSRKAEQPTPIVAGAAAPPAQPVGRAAVVPKPEISDPAERPVRPAIQRSRPKPGRQTNVPRAGYEMSTAFLPLATPVTSRDLDGAQIVRVRLPRSGLAALGIPVVDPVAGDTILADVLIGQDGMAKAIRFVREQPGVQAQ